MRTRNFAYVVFVLILGGLLFVVLRPSKETVNTKPAAAPTVKVAAIGPPIVAAEKVEAAPKTVEGPLGSAVQCANYIESVRTSLPNDRGTTRDMLKGIQATLWVNDYIMAAQKSDGGLPLSASGIIESFTNVSADNSYVKGKLKLYSSFPESLEHHYDRVRNNGAAKDQFRDIEQALKESGVKMNPQSDLLMDCVRLVYLYTEAAEIYGPKQTPTSDATPDPAELAAFRDSFGKVFKYRFNSRYGLETGTSEQLLAKLGGLKLANLSPADMEVPAVLK